MGYNPPAHCRERFKSLNRRDACKRFNDSTVQRFNDPAAVSKDESEPRAEQCIVGRLVSPRVSTVDENAGERIHSDLQPNTGVPSPVPDAIRRPSAAAKKIRRQASVCDWEPRDQTAVDGVNQV